MANLGGGEIIVVLLLALIVLGPERLPKVARQAGKLMADLRRMSAGFQEEVRSAIHDPQPDQRSLPAVGQAEPPKAAGIDTEVSARTDAAPPTDDGTAEPADSRSSGGDPTDGE